MNLEEYIAITESLSLKDIKTILNGYDHIELSKKSVANIKKGRNFLDENIAKRKESVYGINTGFGVLYNKKIKNEDLEKLQNNIVKSHACGTGDEVPHQIVRIMLLLKIQSLAYGHSGVQLETVNRLITLFNEEYLPTVYQLGSLGASGDLAPLAHLVLPLIGEGEVYDYCESEEMSIKKLFKKLDWKPLHLKSKEGLALLNGTQFMGAYGVWLLLKVEKLIAFADIISAISLEGYNGNLDAFNALIHKVRPHSGQQKTAKKFRDLLNGSQIIEQEGKHVQDPYSFRCIPQVHGASKDAFEYVKGVFETEINSVTDNPLLFPEEDLVLSGGNFHGQPLALGLDFLCLAVAELGSISERRTFLLMSGNRELPEMLVADAGLNSGLMILQYTAAAITSQNKQLCTPASADSVVSSNGQEDHVSMGANAATKCFQVVENLERILAIELITATQALEFRKPLNTSSFLQKFVTAFRKEVPFIQEDRVLHNDIENSIAFLNDYEV